VTELTIPERVSSVPKMQSRKVEKRSQIFHVFIIPRFSCIMVECRKAVPVSHGISDAFSTGSQPQYPPIPARISPVHSEDNSAGQKQPCHDRPASGDGKPLVYRGAHHQRTEGEANGS